MIWTELSWAQLYWDEMKWEESFCVCYVDPTWTLNYAISECVMKFAKISLFSFDPLRLRNNYFAQFWFLCADFLIYFLKYRLYFLVLVLPSSSSSFCQFVSRCWSCVVFFYLFLSLPFSLFAISSFIQFATFFFMLCEFVNPLFTSFLRSFWTIYRIFSLSLLFLTNRWMCRKCVPDSGSSVDFLRLRKKADKKNNQLVVSFFVRCNNLYGWQQLCSWSIYEQVIKDVFHTDLKSFIWLWYNAADTPRFQHIFFHISVHIHNICVDYFSCMMVNVFYLSNIFTIRIQWQLFKNVQI